MNLSNYKKNYLCNLGLCERALCILVHPPCNITNLLELLSLARQVVAVDGSEELKLDVFLFFLVARLPHLS